MIVGIPVSNFVIGRPSAGYTTVQSPPCQEVPFLFTLSHLCRLGRPTLPCGCVLFGCWYVGMSCYVSACLLAFYDVVIFHAQIKKDRQCAATGGKNKRVMYVKRYDTLSYYTMPCVINLFQLWTSVLYKTHDKLFFVLRFISASVARFPIS